MKTVSEAVLAYGDTETRAFNLILVFGREFNDVGDVVPRIGEYHFRNKAAGASFWNRSYSFLSYHGALNLKVTIIARNCSPVLFGNALPKAILNRVRDKTSYRDALALDRVKWHISSIFSLPILSRVNCVVVSGLDRGRLLDAKNLILQECRDRHIRLVDLTHYLGSRKSNDKVYNEGLTSEDKDVLRRVLDGFLHKTDT